MDSTFGQRRFQRSGRFLFSGGDYQRTTLHHRRARLGPYADKCAGTTVVAFRALHARCFVCDHADHRYLRLALHSPDQGTLNGSAEGGRRQFRRAGARGSS